MKEKIIVLIPVFNDTASINLLLKNVSAHFGGGEKFDAMVLIVNDGSTMPLTISATNHLPVQMITLHRNIGHQKAIAVGLSYIKEKIVCDKVLVMDGDGQDNPADAIRLLELSSDNPEKIVFAARKSRQESRRFRIFYTLYKVLFRLLTGKQISFGNFLVIPKVLLHKIVFYSEIWNHVSGGILKSGLPYVTVDADRAKRYFDSSKMNFNSLILHGLGAISVFLDIISVRLLIFSFTMILISIVTILFIVGIKFFTLFAIPGWASTVVSSFVIILLQNFLLSFFTIFLYLTSQSQRKLIPAYHYTDYLANVETIRFAG